MVVVEVAEDQGKGPHSRGETGGGSEGAIPVAWENRDVAAEIVGGGEIHVARPDRAAVLPSQNMKPAYASTLALLLLFLVPVGSQQRAENDRKAIEAAEEEIRRIPANWMQSYNAGDADAVTALYAEDGYYLSAHILAHGQAQIRSYWERGIRAGGHIDFIKPLRIEHSGVLAYCAGTYQATNAGVTVDGRVLLVLKKIKGRWLIAAHQTVVRDQPL